jgi:phosphoglycolate phosphatase-like HAD superfamily hydrolase
VKSVFLFDIDGTLVSTGGAGRRSLERAFGSLHWRPDACAHISFDGMTDRAIVRGGLRAIDVEPSDAHIDAVLARYVEVLHEEVRATPDEDYVVHPGARELVAEANAQGHAVGLGTGNIREGARAKLERVALFSPFSFGGFGDDHELRPELIRAGALRGAQRLGVKLAAARVIVIGDTPKDVHAALAIGAQCLGVGTGRHSPRELLAAGATWAVETLADVGARSALFGD